MQRKRTQLSTEDPNWFLADWMTHRGKRQADAFREIGVERPRMNKLYNGKQDFTRADLVLMARWLEIEPYELLISPTEADALRRLRETAYQIAAEDRGREWDPSTLDRPRRSG